MYECNFKSFPYSKLLLPKVATKKLALQHMQCISPDIYKVKEEEKYIKFSAV